MSKSPGSEGLGGPGWDDIGSAPTCGLLSRCMTMTTCACGLQAVGQCTRCERPVCWSHAVHGGTHTDWSTADAHVQKVRRAAFLFGDKLVCMDCLEQADGQQREREAAERQREATKRQREAAKPRRMPDLSDALVALTWFYDGAPADITEAAVAAIERSGGMETIANRIAVMAIEKFPAEQFRGRKFLSGSLTAHVISTYVDEPSWQADDWRSNPSTHIKTAVDDMKTWWTIVSDRGAWKWSRQEIANPNPVLYGRNLMHIYNCVKLPRV